YVLPLDLPSFPTRRSSDLANDLVLIFFYYWITSESLFFNDLDDIIDGIVNRDGLNVRTGNHNFFRDHLIKIENIRDILKLALVEDRKSTRLNSSHVKISYA